MDKLIATATAVATLLFFATAAVAQGEEDNLHRQVHGWHCGMLSVQTSTLARMSLNEPPSHQIWAIIIAICESCERQERDFVAVNSWSSHPTGYCVDRER